MYMTKREEGRKCYSLLNNLCYFLKDMKLAGYQYYIYLIIDIAAQSLVPFILVLIPGRIIEMLQSGKEFEAIALPVCLWIVSILIINQLRVFSHQKYLWMIQMLLETQYWRKLELYWLSCDIRSMEDEDEVKLNDELMNSLYESDGSGNFAGVYGFYIYGQTLCINIIGLILYSLIAGNLHFLLLFILIVTSLINCYAKKKGLNYQFKHMDEFWDNSNQFWYLKSECNNMEKAKDIRMYHYQNHFKKLLENNTKDATSKYDNVTKHDMYSNGVIVINSFIQNAIAYLFLIYQMMNGNVSIAQFIVYIGIVAGFSTWITQIVESGSNITKISYEISLFRSVVKEPIYKLESTEQDTCTCHTIEFQDVCFGYDGTLLFNHFSLKLKQNEKIALVGINGAGKTTLTKLLCGLYPLQSGRILMDGKDISNMNPEQYRKYISILFQDIQIMPFSIAKNIACCCSQEERDELRSKLCDDELSFIFNKVDIISEVSDMYQEKRIIKALEKAKLWDKITTLPKGIHTMLTQVMDTEGIRLSGGETQRLLLARTLYKDAPILVLDEPTAALDPISESELYEEYAKLCNQKISIFISHRLSSTRFCDRILFLEHGNIIEEGTHEQLMNLNGKYANMYQVQAYYYQKEVEKHEAAL